MWIEALRDATYTTGAAHGNTGDTTNLLEADTLESLARLALRTRSNLVGSVNVGASVVRLELLDIELQLRRQDRMGWYVLRKR